MRPTTLKGWLVLATLVLCGASLLAWALWPRAVEVDVGVVDDGVFERTLVRDGKTRLRERHALTAPVAGRLARITLRENDAVERDQIVAHIAPYLTALLDARGLSEQQERVAALAAQLRRAQVLSVQAEAALAQARSDLARNEALAAQGFVSPLYAEAQRLLARQREAERNAAIEDEAAARHQLALAEVALRHASNANANANHTEAPPVDSITTHGTAKAQEAQGASRTSWASGSALQPVRSPISGRVVRILKDSEGEVAQGAVLLEVGDLDRLEFVVDLLTEEAEQVRVGMDAALAGYANGSPMLHARVDRIEPGGYTKVSALGVEEQRVNVVLQIKADADGREQAAWHRLGDAWRLEARIVVQRVDRARRVPSSALFPSGDAMAVFALHGGRARLTPVRVLARNPQHAWIDDALPTGTRVVVYPPSTLLNGQRVRARGS